MAEINGGVDLTNHVSESWDDPAIRWAPDPAINRGIKRGPYKMAKNKLVTGVIYGPLLIL